MFQETSALLAADPIDALVGWRQTVRKNQLCVEGCFVQSLLSFCLRCQSFPAGCGVYFVCPETLACFGAVSVLENIKKKNCLEERSLCWEPFD